MPKAATLPTDDQVSSTSKDVAVVDRTEMTPAAREAKAREILTRAISEMARPEQSPLEMALAIMDAKSDDDVFGSNIIHLQDMLGEAFTVERAWLTDSDYADGLPAFAIIEATLDDGSAALITTGGVNIVSALINFHMRDRFPIRIETKTERTKAGFDVIKVIRPTTERPTQDQLKSF